MTSAPVADRTRPLPQWTGEMGSLVRQPILDEFGLRHGYHLVLKTSSQDHAQRAVSNDALTILDHVVLFGLERLTACSNVFLTCTPEVLTEDLANVLPPAWTVLEMSAGLELTPKLLATCRKLKTDGFRFSLDEVTETAETHPLLPLADYLKMDSTGVDAGGGAFLRRIVKGRPAAMIAAGINSRADHRKALAEGFRYFQGYYFCCPEPLKSAKIEADRLVHMGILGELLKDPLQFNTLCPLIKRDASLVYRLLRQVNSPLYAIRDTINTIESALLILGDTAFRRIACIAVACALNANRPPEVLHAALVRARFCAGSACLCNLDGNDQYLLGLLSLLPGMLGVPMELIAPELPLREKVRNALLGIPVYERCLLDWIECHEVNNASRCRTIAAHYGLDELKLMQSYVDALEWGGAQLGMIA